jgi:hypothetical protein
MSVALLLSMVAPLFHPRKDAFGSLDENVKKVLELFDALADNPSDEVLEAIDWLRGIRVMRTYADVMNKIAS